jgi:hypothetical protein
MSKGETGRRAYIQESIKYIYEERERRFLGYLISVFVEIWKNEGTLASVPKAIRLPLPKIGVPAWQLHI